MLFVKIVMIILPFRGYILVSKLLNQVYSSQKLQNNFRKFYGRHTDPVYTFDKSVSHMFKVASPTVKYDWFPIISMNRDGRHMWDRKCSLSGTPDFTHFGEFMISSINYI